MTATEPRSSSAAVGSPRAARPATDAAAALSGLAWAALAYLFGRDPLGEAIWGGIVGRAQRLLATSRRRGRSVPVLAQWVAAIGSRLPLLPFYCRRAGWLGREIDGRLSWRPTNPLLCGSRVGHDAVARARTRAQDPVVAHEVETGRRNQGRELLDQLLRLEDDMGCAVAPAVLQPVEESTVLEPRESLGQELRVGPPGFEPGRLRL